MGVVMLLQSLCWTLTYIQCLGTIADDSWYDFKVSYGKRYATSEEEEKRKQIFFDNFEKINQLNHVYEEGSRGFRLGINEYADLTPDEIPYMRDRPYLRTSYNGWRGLNVSPVQFQATGAKLPDHVDWREKGVVSPVKHQRGCLACYAFAANDAIESQLALKYGKHVLLSEQQVIDCSGLEGNLGCKGGMVNWSYQYILRAKGVQEESGYPYVRKKNECASNASEIVATITNYGEIKNGSEVSLQEAVAFYGPVSVSISSKDFGWNYFTEGVYENPNCPTEVDHSVLVVGYGTEDNKDYWLVKNSYGESYGDKGYIKMARNKGNQCAIASYANFPIVGEWKPFSPAVSFNNVTSNNGTENVSKTSAQNHNSTSTVFPSSTSTKSPSSASIDNIRGDTVEYPSTTSTDNHSATSAKNTSSTSTEYQSSTRGITTEYKSTISAVYPSTTSTDNPSSTSTQSPAVLTH